VADDLDSLFDSLFATPPAGFIAERKRIVAALKGAGRKADAKEVEKIPRPSVAVWTVNQIARRDPEVIRRLGAITARLQSAAGAEYGAAAAELRQVLDELRGEAAAVLAAAGHDEVGPHLVQRVIANLRAAAGSRETRATLQAGRLTRDVEEQDAAASLFGGALGSGAPPARERPTAKAATTATAATAATKAADARAKAESAAEAKAQERARAKELAAAEREVKRLRDADAAARKDVERAERAVAGARKELDAADKRLAADRAAADDAAHALAEAEAELARLSDS
jgi:hypothetical protein